MGARFIWVSSRELVPIPEGMDDRSPADVELIFKKRNKSMFHLSPDPYILGDSLYTYFWVNYNDLTATSLGIMVSKGNHPLLWP